MDVLYVLGGIETVDAIGNLSLSLLNTNITKFHNDRAKMNGEGVCAISFI